MSYMTKAEKQAYERGIRVAAELASTFDHGQSHPYKIEDCILAKLNMLPKSKIRKNKKVAYPYCPCLFCATSRLGVKTE